MNLDPRIYFQTLNVEEKNFASYDASGYNALLKLVILSSYAMAGVFFKDDADIVIEKLILCVISGFRNCLNEVFALL
jgi:hypothetical protein